MIRPILLMTLAGVSSGNHSKANDQPKKSPNILFVISGDLLFQHTSAYGTSWIKIPNFDKVSRQGILFTNAFVTSPECGPSRASILTGRYPWQVSGWKQNPVGKEYNQKKLKPPYSGISQIDYAGNFDLFLAAMSKRSAEKLYNIQNDPDCMNNQAGKPEFRKVQKQLSRKLITRLKATRDPREVGSNPEIWETYPRVNGKNRKFPQN